MSQGPTFVQAVDGRFYRNPILYGEDWWIYFDDDPYLVIHKKPRMTKNSGLSVAKQVIKDFGEHPKFVDFRVKPYPPDYKLLASIEYEFRLTQAIPIPQKYNAVIDEPGRVWEHCIYGFWSMVEIKDCARVVLGMDIDPIITRALLRQTIYKTKQEKVRAELVKKLYALFPQLREIKKDNWEKQIEELFPTEKVKLEWKSTTL